MHGRSRVPSPAWDYTRAIIYLIQVYGGSSPRSLDGAG